MFQLQNDINEENQTSTNQQYAELLKEKVNKFFA